MTDKKRLAQARAVLAAAQQSHKAQQPPGHAHPGPERSNSSLPDARTAGMDADHEQSAARGDAQHQSRSLHGADQSHFGTGQSSARPQQGRSRKSAGAGHDASASEQARTIILRKLAAGPKTRHQLAKALTQAEIPARDIEQALDRFTELGMINDAEYADILIRSKLRSAHHSKRALRQDLAKVGISRELAEQALQSVDSDDEEVAAKAFIRKRLKALTGRDDEVIQRRIVGALGRRGFPPGQSLSWVREAMSEVPENSNCD